MDIDNFDMILFTIYKLINLSLRFYEVKIVLWFPIWISHVVRLTFQAPVVQKVDNAIHRINHYLVDSVVCFVNTYPLDSDLSS